MWNYLVSGSPAGQNLLGEVDYLFNFATIKNQKPLIMRKLFVAFALIGALTACNSGGSSTEATTDTATAAPAPATVDTTVAATTDTTAAAPAAPAEVK
ncbi:MAG: hypothetical protein ACKO6K_02490 [Chitinophagaceae bacterium]